MKTQNLFVFGLLAMFIGAGADAATITYSNQNAGFQDEELTLEDARTIQTLENDLRILDAEIKKCESSKKGWTAATVIGSAGVVATGVAAIVQGVKISDTKGKISSTNKKTAEINKANNETKEYKEPTK